MMLLKYLQITLTPHTITVHVISAHCISKGINAGLKTRGKNNQ